MCVCVCVCVRVRVRVRACAKTLYNLMETLLKLVRWVNKGYLQYDPREGLTCVHESL